MLFAITSDKFHNEVKSEKRNLCKLTSWMFNTKKKEQKQNTDHSYHIARVEEFSKRPGVLNMIDP